MSSSSQRLNLDNPKWDQNTFLGRFKYFFHTTNASRLFHSSEEFERAKDIVTRHKKGEDFPELSEDDLWRAKYIYDSAYHPDTGEKVNWLGRMSARLPINLLIFGGMLTAYKSKAAIFFWQLVHRSSTAYLTYCNRSGDSVVSMKILGVSYVCSVGGSMLAAYFMHSFLERKKQSFPFLSRLVPFAGVLSAVFIITPTMRTQELIDGIPVVDENGYRVGNSVVAAQHGIARVGIARATAATTVMVIPPIVMTYLGKGQRLLTRHPKLHNPVQIFIVACCVIFATPLNCAVFPQKSAIAVSKLESEIQEKAARLPNSPKILYYNKGL